MKLLSLHIDKYKNLTGDYDFTTQDGYIALIGENGSGKSNLLEAISLIFGKLYKISNIEDIGKFRIRYEIDGTECSYGNIDDDGNDIELEINPKLPSSIISCYSGEDMRLWNSTYRSYYIDFFNKAIQGNSYIPKVLYINKYCWKIAFISLIYSENLEVKDFLTNKLGIDTDEVTIGFTRREQKVVNPHDAAKWYEQVEKKLVEGKIKISDLKGIDLNETQDVNATTDQRIFYYLYFLSMPEKNPNIGLRADKLIENISINIDNNIDFDSLSEGEKKLILIECITKVLGNNDSILLLDEPDAHTHIARKKELLEAIETFEGQTILTTHSPVFVNDIYKHHKDCLFHIENGKIITSQYINALTKLSAGEIDYINGTIVLSSKRLLITEGPYDKRYLEKALDIFCNKDEKYKVLRQVAIIPSNSAGNADAFYEQVLMPQIEKYDKIVFIFDYDEGGYSGWKKISGKGEPKLEALFYQENYSINLDTGNAPQKPNYILVEDFFAPKSYKNKIDEVHLERKTTHKDFRTFTTNISSTIKTYIESNYKNFAEDDYDGFEPILDKLIDIFRL
ncbi:MAG: AAA family ATPase [Muribaculaceae bacterium]|nr:AAA family ATPase [Muribaculaceae bacterium]